MILQNKSANPADASADVATNARANVAKSRAIVVTINDLRSDDLRSNDTCSNDAGSDDCCSNDSGSDNTFADGCKKCSW